MLRDVLRVVLPLAILGLGVAASGVLRDSAATAEAKAPPPVSVSVEVLTVSSAERPTRVSGTGTVLPGAQVDLIAQVSGRIVDMATGLTPGTRFQAGDVIARIDARDYENALATAKSNLAQAELDLALEEARVAQAAREWALSGQTGESPLALRQPHLEAAKGRLAAAKAGVSNANLALERTRLVAPFDGVILTESIDIGQIVAPGAPVARIAGTAKAKVRVAVPVGDLQHIDVPGINADDGSVAIIRQDLGDGRFLEIDGKVQRALGELDPETRTATILVSIDDPMNRTTGGLPILPGAWVNVTVEGRATQRTFELPRAAIVDGDAVWLASPDNTLQRADVTISWSGPDTVFVSAGLNEGDRVVLTPLSLPVVGMPLTVRDPAAPAADPTAAPADPTPANPAAAPAEPAPAEPAAAPAVETP